MVPGPLDPLRALCHYRRYREKFQLDVEPGPKQYRSPSEICDGLSRRAYPVQIRGRVEHHVEVGPSVFCAPDVALMTKRFVENCC